MLNAGTFSIPADHPALPGHFPGNEVVPGVVLLDHMLAALTRHIPAFRLASFRQVKFLAPVRHSDEITVLYRSSKSPVLAFACLRQGETILTGTLMQAVSAGEAAA